MSSKLLTRGLIAPAFLAASLALTGCGLGGGQTLVKYEKGQIGSVRTAAPSDGEVALSGSSDIVNAKIRYQVDKGDEVGFRDEREDGQGRVVAYAGDSEYIINQGTVLDRTFYWQFREEED